MINPKSPPYDALEWDKMPFALKTRLVCQAWAIQGYGSPPSVYLLYALKLLFYIYGWTFFCSFTPGLGEIGAFRSWWFHPIAFQKAIVWSMLFEVMGLGCGSGPLTGRYLPPIGGFTYFLRPGTTRLPYFENAPLVGGKRRNILDVSLYLGLLVSLTLVLLSPAPDFYDFLPVIIITPLLGILDKTIFLAARSEHYLVTIIVFAFAPATYDWIAGAMIVQLALWFFAGFSKLNHHFASVVCVMASNGPFTPFEWFRKSMYKNYPDDLRPSTTAVIKAYMGTALEISVPLVLLGGVLGGSTTVITVGLVLMVILHSYIISSVPMGVPTEWNFMVLYGGFFLFLANGQITPLDLGSPLLAAFLIICSIIIPLLGNIRPDLISFLLAMRYYAGNWPYSVWLFKDGSYQKLEKLTKSAPWLYDQLDILYERKVAVGLVGKVIAWRMMHLQGRALQKLVPRAVDLNEFPKYQWLDGELVAGLALGWNFGDGHLSNEQLLRSLSEQCGFEEGEVRCIFVESQPLGKGTLQYRIHDAVTGLMDKGELNINELRRLQSWPEA